MEIKWIDFKTLINNYGAKHMEIQTTSSYYLTIIANNIVFSCELNKDASVETVDYETNYHGTAKTSVFNNANGKMGVVSSSRPPNTKTCFTMRGDSETTIGEGQLAAWDFSNNYNDVTAYPGRKKKHVDISFKEEVWIKEGCVYFHNAKKTTFCNMDIICPVGGYIKLPSGEIVGPMPVEQNVSRYVLHHLIQGTCPMGDELNTEEAQENALPVGYLIRLEIDAPDTDNDSNGYVSFELYRKETI